MECSMKKTQNKTQTNQEAKLCICIVWLKIKKIHDLLIGPASTHSWISFPVTLPLARFSVTILTWLTLKPYSPAVTSESASRLSPLPAEASKGLPHLHQGGLPWPWQ